MKRPDGIALYTQSIDDGNSSQFSLPSLPSTYSDGSATRLAGGRPPPPHAMVRTNFTTAARTSIPDNNESPGVGYNDVYTPAELRGPTHQFVDAVAPQQQEATSSTTNMVIILVCVVLGFGVGTLLNHYNVDSTVSEWINTPGDLYIRAIQCIVVPLVFVNLAVSVADLVHIGKGHTIGIRVALIFALTMLIGVFEGLGLSYLARLFWLDDSKITTSSDTAVFGIECSNGLYMEQQTDGSVTCTAATLNTTSQFQADDINSALVRTSTTSTSSGTLSDNLIAILEMIVPSNITAAFVDATLLSIVAFAIPCGIALAKSFHGPVNLNPMLEFLREVNEALVTMINMVIYFTPLAVFSLVAGSFGDDLGSVLDVSPMVVTLKVALLFLVAAMLHMLVVMPAIFTAFTHANPFAFMKHMVPAYVFCLGCSSSMATLPVSMRCIEQSQAVSNSIKYFVMSIGASINMAGTAMYLPMMVFFIVDASGMKDQLGSFEVGVLVIAAFLGSLAAAPVPAGSLVMLITVWKIVFPSTDLPSMYNFVVAADAVLDRLVTLVNVNGDAMICRIIADQIDETVADEIMPTHHQPMAGM